MKLPIYQVDAFADRVFRGNPAAVVLLEEKLTDEVLQAIASENNLSETAFVLPGDGEFQLRWFTPTLEVDLCGHATLATAFVLFDIGKATVEVNFKTASGRLTVVKSGDLLSMDFPALPPEPVAIPSNLSKALGSEPAEVLSAQDLMAVFKTEEAVASLQPNFEELGRLDAFAVITTAPGREVDFVSRFFAPKAGIPEDPVTGSAHCTLTPFWAARLGKRILRARQVSRRGGELLCEERGDRVTISGRAIEYLRGEINF
jgi:PhzF family phenazine biosynthesis protein